MLSDVFQFPAMSMLICENRATISWIVVNWRDKETFYLIIRMILSILGSDKNSLDMGATHEPENSV